MQSTIQSNSISKTALWAGRITSALPALLILFSAIFKLTKSAAVVQGFAHAGYSEALIVPIGIIEVICVVVYLIPRTTFLGAILLTGLMGGATATNVRVGDPSYFMTILLGIMIWGGLFFRDSRLRSLIPFQR